MDKEQIEKVIAEFNDTCEPFYIVDHEDGVYSLCYPIDMVEEEIGQAAFDAYAEERGEPVCDVIGLKTYGSGYDWESAFRKYFETDPHIQDIHFDCESSGFFCDSNDLETLADMGRRFHKVASNTEEFTPIISAGIKEADAKRAEEKALMKTVRGQFMKYPAATFYIRTPDGDLIATPIMTQTMLSGELPHVQIANTTFNAEEFLGQRVCGVQKDLFDENVVRLKTEIEQSEEITQGQVQKL